MTGCSAGNLGRIRGCTSVRRLKHLSQQSYNYPFKFLSHAQVISHAETVVSNKDIASHKSLLRVRRNYINTQLPRNTSPREPPEELNASMIAAQTPEINKSPEAQRGPDGGRWDEGMKGSHLLFVSLCVCSLFCSLIRTGLHQAGEIDRARDPERISILTMASAV